MSESFLGEITLFAFNQQPQGWLPCDGRTLQIQQYQALFSLIGVQYGGSMSQGTFNLPDLRGRVPVGYGVMIDGNRVVPQGTALAMAAAGGQETVTLTTTQIPPHTHQLGYAPNNPPASPSMVNSVLSVAGRAASTPATAPNPPGVYAAVGGPTTTINPATISTEGGGGAHENRQPYLALQYCICATQGLYPQRS